MKKVIALIMVAGILTGGAFSSENKKETKRVSRKSIAPDQRTPKESRSAIPGSPDRRERLARSAEGRLRQMAEVHKKAIDELEEIKKIAGEENATRTVEAIQKMIDKNNAEYQKNIEQFTRQQKERAERIRRRTHKSEPKVPEKKEVKEDTAQKESGE